MSKKVMGIVKLEQAKFLTIEGTASILKKTTLKIEGACLK
jgi:hypothetical protein